MAVIRAEQEEGIILKFLYHTIPGRMVLKGLTLPAVSRLCGRFLDSGLSKRMIPRFIKKCKIEISDYVEQEYTCFNDFFCRKIRPQLRPIEQKPDALVAPCDGRLSVLTISEDTVFPIKQSVYKVSDLLGGDPVYERFQNGLCLVFRLCVDDYHRYCYFDTGNKGENVFLPGVLHTVRPIALAAVPVFTQNCREYTVMETAHFGTAVQIEIGAMLVGKIKNHMGSGSFTRGQEKGMFLYGGSTIVLLLEPGRAELLKEILHDTEQGLEVPVRMGQVIGWQYRKS